MSCDSLQWPLEEFLSVFYAKVHTNLEVDFPFALENLDLLNDPLVSGNHLPRMGQFTGVWTNFTHLPRESELAC